MSALVQLEEGRLFGGDFRVLEPLKHGGMGSVYVVEQLQTGARRALKLMHPQLVQDPKFRKRFEQEARIGAQIPSEHVVQVIAAGVDANTGTAWLVMELLEGEDLDTCLRRRGQLPQAEATEVLGQLCHALAAAHSVGIVHRDLKPANIFLAVARRRGVPFTVKVLDFGIAKIVAESSTTATEAVGSPMWMAPEQTTQDHEIMPATDVWALGLLTFRLLTGRYYWKAPNKPGATTAMLFREILIEPLPSAAQRAAEHGVAGLPKGFDAWFARCVAREPEARFANAGEAFAMLEKILVPRQGSSPNIDMLGWKESKEPHKGKRSSDDPIQRSGTHRQTAQNDSSPRRLSKPEILAPVADVPPARERIETKAKQQPPPVIKHAVEKKAESTAQVPFHELEEHIQRASRLPAPPPGMIEQEEAPESITVPPETEESYSAPDTIPAVALKKPAASNVDEVAERAKAAAEALKARTDAEAARIAKETPAPQRVSTPPAQPSASRAPATEAAKTPPPVKKESATAEPAARPTPPPPPVKKEPATAEPAARPTPPPPPAGQKEPAAAKPAQSPPLKKEPVESTGAARPGSTTTPSVPTAAPAASTPKPISLAQDTDSNAVETVSGVANTSPDALTPSKPGSKKLTRLGVIGGAAVAALLITVLGVRSYQQGRSEQVCATDAGPGDAAALRASACNELCSAGSAVHCVTRGDLLLGGDPVTPEDRQAAAAAYKAACDLHDEHGCAKAAQLSASPDRATTAPTTSPAASAAPETPGEIVLDMSPAKHIVVMYQHSLGAPATITRTKEQARTRAVEALTKLKGGAKFEDVVREYSDDALSRDHGGALDAQMMGRLLSTIERMKAGEMDVTETPAGWHVVLRLDNPIPAPDTNQGGQPRQPGDPQGASNGQPTNSQGSSGSPSTAHTGSSGSAGPSGGSGSPTTPPTSATATPTPTPTPTATAAAGPPDEAAMRRSLEPKVMNGNASLDEMRLLKAICQHQGDRQCSNRVSAMIKEKQSQP